MMLDDLDILKKKTGCQDEELLEILLQEARESSGLYEPDKTDSTAQESCQRAGADRLQPHGNRRGKRQE